MIRIRIEMIGIRMEMIGIRMEMIRICYLAINNYLTQVTITSNDLLAVLQGSLSPLQVQKSYFLFINNPVKKLFLNLLLKSHILFKKYWLSAKQIWNFVLCKVPSNLFRIFQNCRLASNKSLNVHGLDFQ